MAVDVAIFGGGIGGLSAAHHLVKVGMKDVHIYEACADVGGKAKSQYCADGYPGEHGFRFFPHFYRHIVDTMKSIPTSTGSVWDRLVPSSKGGIAYDGTLYVVDRPVPLHEPRKFIETLVQFLGADELNDPADIARFAAAMFKFATSCDERRRQQYDEMTWEDFTGGPKRFHPAFYAIVIQATRNLAAMRAHSSSAATIGSMCLQMIFDFDPGHPHKIDAVLDGPTDDVWLRPWRSYLQSQGVVFHTEERLLGFDFAPPAIRAAMLSSGTVKARHYVCAIPLEQMVTIANHGMRAFDPALEALATLAPTARGDMVGAQFFLKRDVPIIHGHIHFPKAPFGLTAVSQPQFWSQRPDFGIVSVIISDWDGKGSDGTRARDHTDRGALLREVWRQLQENLPPGTLADDDIVAMHLDDNVGLGPFSNPTPLLIHPVGQRRLRPEAKNAIANLYLAADYVRTYTDLASMEGADEASRRAVGAIMADSGIAGPKPIVQPLTEGNYFDWAKRIDRFCFERGWPHPMDLPSGALHLGDLLHHVPDPGGGKTQKALDLLRKFGDLAKADPPDMVGLEQLEHALDPTPGEPE